MVYSSAAQASNYLSFGAATEVGGNMTLGLASGDAEILGGVIGGNLVVNGRGKGNAIRLGQNRNLNVGGNVTVKLLSHGQINNYLGFLDSGQTNTVGGRLTYVGGTAADTVELQATTVAKDVSVALGGSSDSSTVEQFFTGTSNASVTVYGSLKVSGLSNNEIIINLRRLYVGNALRLATGSNPDFIYMNDVNVAGPTLIDLGAGTDELMIEGSASDNVGSLPGATTFGGTFTVRAGAGDDLVGLSDDFDATTLIRFGARVALLGGAGIDALNNAGNEFMVTGNFEDFENGNSLP